MVKQTYVQPEFATALLTFASVTYINKNKYLVFAELKSIDQIKQICGKFSLKMKRPSFYGYEAQKLETFS